MSSICNMNDRSRWHIYLPLYWWNVMKRRAKKGRRTDKNQRNDDKKVKIMSCWEDVCLCLCVCVLYIAKWRLPGFWSIVIRHRSWQIFSTNKNVYLRKSLCICSSVCLCVCVERNHRVYLMCVCVFFACNCAWTDEWLCDREKKPTKWNIWLNNEKSNTPWKNWTNQVQINDRILYYIILNVCVCLVCQNVYTIVIVYFEVCANPFGLFALISLFIFVWFGLKV